MCVCEGVKEAVALSTRGQPGVNLSEHQQRQQHPFAAMLDKTESSDLELTSDLLPMALKVLKNLKLSSQEVIR